MKKIFTLLAVAAMAVSAQAADVYSWASTDGNVTEVGGTITYENGDGNRLNYANTVGDITYYTVCLNGKKANMGDSPASANAGYMKLVLNAPLQAGDKLELNGYINKDNPDAKANAYIVFKGDGDATLAEISETDSYPNVNADGGAQQPGTHVIDIPTEAVGCNTICMTRNLANTNVFLITVKVTREGGDSSLDAITAENAPVEYFNLQGVRVDNPANGLYIRRQGNNVTKVVVK